MREGWVGILCVLVTIDYLHTGIFYPVIQRVDEIRSSWAGDTRVL